MVVSLTKLTTVFIFLNKNVIKYSVHSFTQQKKTYLKIPSPFPLVRVGVGVLKWLFGKATTLERCFLTFELQLSRNFNNSYKVIILSKTLEGITPLPLLLQQCILRKQPHSNDMMNELHYQFQCEIQWIFFFFNFIHAV